MSLSLPPTHNRFVSVVISSSFLWLIAEVPFLFNTDWSVTDVLVATLFNLAFSFVLFYWWLFGDNRPIRTIVIFHMALLAIMHPFIIGIHHWDIVGGSGNMLSLQRCIEFVNLNFGILVLIVSTLAAYTIAKKKSDAQSLRSYSSLEWTLLTLNMKNHTFGSMKNLPFIHSVYWPLCVVGGVYLLWFMNEFADYPTLISNVKIMAIVQMVAMILVYRVGLVLGEGLRLIQIERMIPGAKFHLDNFEEFLKWRHDYVKYHLPAPIRKLNLRLFNQHVEAYERLQQEVKISRT